MSGINFYFREKGKAFSIEKIFEELAESIESGQDTVKRLYCPFPGGRNLFNLARNGFWARRHAAEINHITGDAHYLALFLPRKSCVLTIHDCDMLAALFGLRRWLVWLLWLYLPVRFAGVVTVISERTKEELCRLTKIDDSKVFVISDFVSDSFKFAPKPEFPRTPRLLVLGTKVNKNIPRIVESLSELKLELRIIGELTQQQKSQLEQSGLNWTNAFRLSDEEVLQEYVDSDFVLFPSLSEGFGMPIIEAQAIGRPVITSDISPMKDVAGIGAVLVDPESVESIRDAVILVLSDSDLRLRLISDGQQNVAQYSKETVSKQYTSIYDSQRKT